MFIEKGIKQQDGPVIMPTNINIKAIFALKNFANKRNTLQGQECRL